MRTYLILKEKVKQFDADKEIQALLGEIEEKDSKLAALSKSYSRRSAETLKKTAFDRQQLASRRLAYERLDQLVVDLLLGVR
jgi:xylose isomerase